MPAVDKHKPQGSKNAQKSAARLMAVQAVYQLLSNPDAKPKGVEEEYMIFRAGMEVDGEKMVSPDRPMFKTLLKGVTDKREELDGLIAASRTDTAERAEGAPAKTTEPLLYAILLCGAYELLASQDIDPPIIISDYINVTKAFYDQSEPAFVNGVLNALLKTLR